jgi:hypothetical protein
MSDGHCFSARRMARRRMNGVSVSAQRSRPLGTTYRSMEIDIGMPIRVGDAASPFRLHQPFSFTGVATCKMPGPKVSRDRRHALSTPLSKSAAAGMVMHALPAPAKAVAEMGK